VPVVPDNNPFTPDSETLTMRRTVIGGIRYSDDYQVINGEIIL
jgi:hypothetical protein